jgi:hypothetical protein
VHWRDDDDDVRSVRSVLDILQPIQLMFATGRINLRVCALTLGKSRLKTAVFCSI